MIILYLTRLPRAVPQPILIKLNWVAELDCANISPGCLCFICLEEEENCGFEATLKKG